LSLHLSVHLYVCLSICQLNCPSVCELVCLSIQLPPPPVFPSVCLLNLSVTKPDCQPASLLASLHACLPLNLYILHPSVYLSLCPSNFQTIHPFVGRPVGKSVCLSVCMYVCMYVYKYVLPNLFLRLQPFRWAFNLKEGKE